MSKDSAETVETQDELGVTKRSARIKLREAHIGLYMIVRFIATWFTVTMIATFLAESLLNTLRMNQALATQGISFLESSPLIQYFSKFYPSGTSIITLISTDLVIVYLFAIAVYAIVRFTYHKAVREDGVEPFVGGLTWTALKEKQQPLSVRLCWLLTPRNGVHKKFFLCWMVYVFCFGITTSIGGLLGVSIYLSPELKLALYGGGVAFGLGLLEDLRIFQKIPPKEAIWSGILALAEGVIRRDFSGTVKRLSAIRAETQHSETDEAIELLTEFIGVLKTRQEEARQKETTPSLEVVKKD